MVVNFIAHLRNITQPPDKDFMHVKKALSCVRKESQDNFVFVQHPNEKSRNEPIECGSRC